jgi:hypothetical protein
MAAAGLHERMLGFADRRLRLRFAGSALTDLVTTAFAPRLIENTGTADATIGLWEESRVPGGAQPVSWTEADLGARGLVRGAGGDRVVAIHEAGSMALTMVDLGARALLYRIPDVSSLPWWERAAPLRAALFWALGGPRRHLVHAGAVGDEQRGGVLLAGAGGSGKTTVALASLRAGMSYVADDYLLLDTEAAPVAWNLFGIAKLDAGHMARFPELACETTISAEPVPDEKAILDVHRLMPRALASSLPIRAVLVPRIRGGHARLRPASAGEALLALAPSTAFQMPFDGGRVMGALAAAARAVPAFALDVGDDPRELAQAVDRALDECAAEGEPKLGPISVGSSR